MTTKFQDIDNFTIEDINSALDRDDPEELRLVSLTLALSCDDAALAEKICVRLSLNQDNEVRGNALISLGHLARRFRRLEQPRVKEIIEAGLKETDEYVRQHAKSAADEIHQFLGWIIEGHVYG